MGKRLLCWGTSATIFTTEDGRLFSNVHRKMRESGLFTNASSTAGRPARQNVSEKGNFTEVAQSSPRLGNRFHVARMTVWETLHNKQLYSYHKQRLTILNPRTWVGCWYSAVNFMHAPVCIATFRTATRHSLLAMEWTTSKTSIYVFTTIHTER